MLQGAENYWGALGPTILPAQDPDLKGLVLNGNISHSKHGHFTWNLLHLIRSGNHILVIRTLDATNVSRIIETRQRRQTTATP